ncbi:MAG: HigA family addiction module antitoxin [Parvibaculaceae bacterium]
MSKKMPPLHPGEVLREEFLVPFKMTANGLAKALNVPRSRIQRLSREKGRIATDTALRLARYFGTSTDFWQHLQSDYDKGIVEQGIAKEIKAIKPIKAT